MLTLQRVGQSLDDPFTLIDENGERWDLQGSSPAFFRIKAQEASRRASDIHAMGRLVRPGRRSRVAPVLWRPLDELLHAPAERGWSLHHKRAQRGLFCGTLPVLPWLAWHPTS